MIKDDSTSGKDLLAIRLGLVGIALAAILVNVLAVSVVGSLERLAMSPEVLALNERMDANRIVQFVSTVLLFPLTLVMVTLYSLPYIRAFWNGKPASKAGRRASHRLVSAPGFVGIVTISGWILGVISDVISGPIMLGALPLEYYTGNLIEAVVLSGASFVVTYYLAETILRSVLVPRLFKENEVLEIRASMSPGIGTRLVVFALSIGVAPSLLFAATILILNDGGKNAAGKDLSPTLAAALVAFAVILVLVTWLKSLSIEAPLVELRDAAARLGSGDFRARITVSSDDEIGTVAGAFNDMAKGLEERERMRSIFGRVVDPRVRDHLLTLDKEGGGRLQEATVVFLDLAGFTSLSEALSPERIVALLDTWFEAVAVSIEREGGLVNKFIGDGALAVFGVPGDLGDHAARALRSIDALRANMRLASPRLMAMGVPALRFRAGIHTGKVFAGIVGTRERQEYTVIGDAVNVASRLEQLSKDFNTSVVLSRATRDAAAQDREYRVLGETTIRGKKEKLELFGLDEESFVQIIGPSTSG